MHSKKWICYSFRIASLWAIETLRGTLNICGCDCGCGCSCDCGCGGSIPYKLVHWNFYNSFHSITWFFVSPWLDVQITFSYNLKSPLHSLLHWGIEESNVEFLMLFMGLHLPCSKITVHTHKLLHKVRRFSWYWYYWLHCTATIMIWLFFLVERMDETIILPGWDSIEGLL